MAEQSVDVVVLRQHSVQETLPKEVVEQKIAVIKEEKKKEAEEKEAKKKEEMELALSVCCSPYCAREFNNPCYDSSKRLLPNRTASITSYCTTVTWSLEMRMVTTSPVSPSSSAGISTGSPPSRRRMPTSFFRLGKGLSISSSRYWLKLKMTLATMEEEHDSY